MCAMRKPFFDVHTFSYMYINIFNQKKMLQIINYNNYKIGFINDDDKIPTVVRCHDNLIIPYTNNLQNEYSVCINDDELNLKVVTLSELMYLTKAELPVSHILLPIFTENGNYRTIFFLTYRKTDSLKYNYNMKCDSVMIKLSQVSQNSINPSAIFNSEVEACLKLQASRNSFRGKIDENALSIERYKVSYEVKDLSTNEVFIFTNKHKLLKQFGKKIKNQFNFFKDEGNDILKLKILYN